MTAPTYDTLTTDDTGADKILTTGTVTALDQNPVSIAQRGTDAPVVQVPVRVQKNPGDVSWPWPDGVTAAMFTLIAGGGNANGDGGDTTITYNSITYTAKGGKSGRQAGVPTNAWPGEGGSGGTCDVGIPGEPGIGYGGGTLYGRAGLPGVLGASAVAPTVGAGGAGDGTNGSGGGGETGFVRLVKVDGLNTVTISIGAGSTAGAGADGANGAIFISY